MRKNAQANWDDMRFVLAVADHGSVASAARVLNVNHATVLRRIAAFETQHGLKVFERTTQGYQLSADRRALIEAMREAGDALGQVETMIASERPRLGHGIRVTSTDTFCQSILPSILASLSQQILSPVDILSGNSHIDFARLQADITVRPTPKLPDDLVGEMAGRFRFGVYRPFGQNVENWLGLSGAITRTSAAGWMKRNVPQGEISLTADSFTALAGLITAGQGRALLPVFLGDSWPGVERETIPDEIGSVPIWVASHTELAGSSRLARARSFIAKELKKIGPTLMGAD